MVLRRWWWEWRCGRWMKYAGGLLRPAARGKRCHSRRRRSLAAGHQCACRRGSRVIDGEGCADAEALIAEAMPSIQARCQACPVEKQAVTWCVRRSVRRDAFQAQIYAGFPSLRTARSRCVAPLEVVPDAFSAPADANGHSTYCVAPFEMP
jgi:hypothetical protein